MRRFQHSMGLTAFCLLILLLSACHSAQEEAVLEKAVAKNTDLPTYQMYLCASVADYDAPATRATVYQWSAGAKLYLTFKVGTQNVTGTAVYQGGDLWTVTPSASLPETGDGQCTVAFFVDEQKVTSSTVTLNKQTRAYFDAAATYEQIEDVLSVVGTLTPVAGRVRFAGVAGRQTTVSGLQFNTSFDLGNHKFASTAEPIAVSVADDGLSPYYYAAFATDERQLVVTVDAHTAWRRAFAAHVLQQGQSGRITLPTEASHGGWTLINTDNQQPITLPVLSEQPQTSGLSFKSVSLTASVTSTGNGRLKDAGFVLSTSHNPTLADRKLSCGTSASLSGRMTGLQPETTYYVRAYAQNEAGTAYSTKETTLTTKKKPDDTSFDLDDFGDDSIWDNQ